MPYFQMNAIFYGIDKIPYILIGVDETSNNIKPIKYGDTYLFSWDNPSASIENGNLVISYESGSASSVGNTCLKFIAIIENPYS